MSTAARGGRSSGRATTAATATRGPQAAAAAPPPPAPLSSSQLPQQLVNLSTLVLVSRAAAETATGGAVTHARQQPLDALSHLVTSYLSLAATQATHAANLAGRTRIAPWDVLTALADIGYPGKRGLDDLLHEASKRDHGVEPEAEQLRQLATALQGPSSFPFPSTAPKTHQPPGRPTRFAADPTAPLPNVLRPTQPLRVGPLDLLQLAPRRRSLHPGRIRNRRRRCILIFWLGFGSPTTTRRRRDQNTTTTGRRRSGDDAHQSGTPE